MNFGLSSNSPDRYSRGVTLMQRKGSGGTSGFFYFFLLFIGISRLLMDYYAQGFSIMAIAIALFLWRRGADATQHPALNISEAGLIVPNWGAYPWEKIAAIWIEHYPDRKKESYNLRIHTRMGEISEVTLEGLEILPDEFAQTLQHYAPTWVDITQI